MNKRRIVQIILICLSVSAVFSCTTQRSLFFTGQTVIRTNNNSIERNGASILKIAPSVLSLKEKGLTFEERLLSEDMRKYIYTILQECHSSQDTLIAVSQDFIVLKNIDTNQEPDANYIYRFDFDIGRWVCSYTDVISENITSIGEPCTFLRKAYVVKQRNRVIIKDYFRDISIIYVIQGRDNKTDFRTTSAWNPSDFPALITTTNYIRERIDPISYDIAKGKCFN